MIAQEQAQDRRIVVGIDNSAGSAEALRWALAYARQTGTTVFHATCSCRMGDGCLVPTAIAPPRASRI